MNLFKKLYSQLKDKIKETTREKELKASHQAYISELKEKLAKYETKLVDHITNHNSNFRSIMDVYEDMELLKDQIKMANEAYEYIFKETSTSSSDNS